jgi:hypothetical protein
MARLGVGGPARAASGVYGLKQGSLRSEVNGIIKKKKNRSSVNGIIKKKKTAH